MAICSGYWTDCSHGRYFGGGFGSLNEASSPSSFVRTVPDVKAIVVGAGIAGLVAARQLGLAGWDVDLLEKSRGPRPDGYMMDFFGPGVEASEKIGLYPRLAAAAYHVEAAEYVDDTGRTTSHLDYGKFSRFAGGAVLTLLRPDMERAALAALGDVPSGRIHVHYSAPVSRAWTDGDGGHVSVRGSADAWRGADVLIGADGIHSEVRNGVFGPERDYLRPLGMRAAAFIASDVQLHERFRNRFMLTDSIGRMAGFYSLRADEVAVFLVYRDTAALGGRRGSDSPGEATARIQRSRRLGRPAFGTLPGASVRRRCGTGRHAKLAHGACGISRRRLRSGVAPGGPGRLPRDCRGHTPWRSPRSCGLTTGHRACPPCLRTALAAGGRSRTGFREARCLDLPPRRPCPALPSAVDHPGRRRAGNRPSGGPADHPHDRQIMSARAGAGMCGPGRCTLPEGGLRQEPAACCDSLHLDKIKVRFWWCSDSSAKGKIMTDSSEFEDPTDESAPEVKPEEPELRGRYVKGDYGAAGVERGRHADDEEGQYSQGDFGEAGREAACPNRSAAKPRKPAASCEATMTQQGPPVREQPNPR